MCVWALPKILNIENRIAWTYLENVYGVSLKI